MRTPCFLLPDKFSELSVRPVLLLQARRLRYVLPSCRSSTCDRLHVAARRGLDHLVSLVAERIARGHPAARLLRQPFAPRGPPASLHALRVRHPFIGIGAGLLAGPVITLVLRGGIHDARDVPARTE